MILRRVDLDGGQKERKNSMPFLGSMEVTLGFGLLMLFFSQFWRFSFSQFFSVLVLVWVQFWLIGD